MCSFDLIDIQKKYRFYKMETLPTELIESILKMNIGEDPRDILQYCQINRQFGDLCRSDAFWRELTLNRFGYVDKINDS